jgi:hypothetical protein
MIRGGFLAVLGLFLVLAISCCVAEGLNSSPLGRRSPLQQRRHSVSARDRVIPYGGSVPQFASPLLSAQDRRSLSSWIANRQARELQASTLAVPNASRATPKRSSRDFRGGAFSTATVSKTTNFTSTLIHDANVCGVLPVEVVETQAAL